MTVDVKDIVMCKPTPKSRKQEFFDCLPTLGPTAFGELLEAFNRNGGSFIVAELTKELQGVLNEHCAVMRRHSSGSETTAKSVDEGSYTDQLDSLSPTETPMNISYRHDINQTLPPELTGIDRPPTNNLNLDYPEREVNLTELNLVDEDKDAIHSVIENDTQGFSQKPDSQRQKVEEASVQAQEPTSDRVSFPTTVQPQPSQVDVVNLMLEGAVDKPSLALTSHDFPVEPMAVVPAKGKWVEDLKNKSRVITDKELTLIAQGMSSTSYFVVGTLMGFRKGKLEQYQANMPHSVGMQIAKMFMDWRACQGRQATVAQFITIMQDASIDEQEYQDIICSHTEKISSVVTGSGHNSILQNGLASYGKPKSDVEQYV